MPGSGSSEDKRYEYRVIYGTGNDPYCDKCKVDFDEDDSYFTVVNQTKSLVTSVCLFCADDEKSAIRVAMRLKR